jgi:hypothetical protein
MSSTAPTTLFVVPCSQEKHYIASDDLLNPATMRAEQLYRGQAFRMAQAHLKAAGASWCILSARHGFLWPSTPITWYDQKLTESEVRGIEAGTADWYPFDALSNRQYAKLCTARTVVTLGSKLYARAVQGLLEKYAFRAEIARVYHAPFAGLQIGQMLQAIKRGDWLKRCPTCAAPTHTLFDHIGTECQHA